MSMYARGIDRREIDGHLRELYALDVSAELISTVTDAVMEKVAAWQNRPLERRIPWFSLTRSASKSGTRASFATRLSMWRRRQAKEPRRCSAFGSRSEGAKFWLRVMTELKNRGVEDILIAVVDGLKGFPEAIGVAFPTRSCRPALSI